MVVVPGAIGRVVSVVEQMVVLLVVKALAWCVKFVVFVVGMLVMAGRRFLAVA